MRFLLRKTSSSVSRSTGSWLTLLLLFVVLVPSIGLLWFLNEAVQNEQLVVRQKLIDAYRAQLVGAQERLEANWRRQMDDLSTEGVESPGSGLFARLVRADHADAVVCFDQSGITIYPDALPVPEFRRLPFIWATADTDPTSVSEFWRAPKTWAAARDLELSDPAAAARTYAQLAAESMDLNVAARALQAQARSLARAGDIPAAVELLTSALQEPKYRNAHDTQGRLLAPNADLMALELLGDPQSDAARAPRERLQARVLDYEHTALPSAQRRFLMREVQRLTGAGLAGPELVERVEAGPGPATSTGSGPAASTGSGPVTAAPVSTMLAAEDLAVAWLAAQKPSVREPALRASALAGVWQHTSPDGRIVLLHRREKLTARLHALIAPSGLPADVRLDFIEPGREAESALLALSAGPALPGWRLALVLDDPDFFATATNKQISSYVWIVVLIVVAALVLALLALGLVRRQVALTQLRNDLVANVTHELKTPLASMRLLVETLLHAPQLNEQTTREYLQLIATENLRLSRLIGNFLTFSRIERNKYTFDFKPVSPQAIVDSAVAAVGDRFQAPGCRFDVKVATELPTIAADPDAVVTALVNLLDNAWKYSGDAKQIALTAGTQNGSVTFAVRDNGIGLAPRDAKRVFQRFYQVRQPQSTSGGGSGLGLSIVQFIVTAHRGTVHVESEPGCGSTFTIVLPAAEVIR